MVSRAPCDVCGKPDGRYLTESERALWPSVAAWVKTACADCRGRFRRNAERFGKAAA